MMTSQTFEQIISEFSDIVDSHSILKDEDKGGVQIFKAKILFHNSSKMAMSDHFAMKFNTRKYSFHWMSEDNSLLVRWDNADHHSQIETFPHHKHVERNENIHPSEEVGIRDVLIFIRETLEH